MTTPTDDAFEKLLDDIESVKLRSLTIEWSDDQLEYLEQVIWSAALRVIDRGVARRESEGIDEIFEP